MTDQHTTNDQHAGRCHTCNAPLSPDALAVAVRDLRSIIQDAGKLADRIDAHQAEVAEIQRLVNLPYPAGECSGGMVGLTEDGRPQIERRPESEPDPTMGGWS